ncbi:MAG: hypothetical protein GF411_17130 [Candidatus Lokiarchaeota archaeon]|nr:hypothetical protein [Candidatus Lokiarchaeota archaeon]
MVNFKHVLPAKWGEAGFGSQWSRFHGSFRGSMYNTGTHTLYERMYDFSPGDRIEWTWDDDVTFGDVHAFIPPGKQIRKENMTFPSSGNWRIVISLAGSTFLDKARIGLIDSEGSFLYKEFDEESINAGRISLANIEYDQGLERIYIYEADDPRIPFIDAAGKTFTGIYVQCITGNVVLKTVYFDWKATEEVKVMKHSNISITDFDVNYYVEDFSWGSEGDEVTDSDDWVYVHDGTSHADIKCELKIVNGNTKLWVYDDTTTEYVQTRYTFPDGSSLNDEFSFKYTPKSSTNNITWQVRDGDNTLWCYLWFHPSSYTLYYSDSSHTSVVVQANAFTLDTEHEIKIVPTSSTTFDVYIDSTKVGEDLECYDTMTDTDKPFYRNDCGTSIAYANPQSAYFDEYECSWETSTSPQVRILLNRKSSTIQESYGDGIFPGHSCLVVNTSTPGEYYGLNIDSSNSLNVSSRIRLQESSHFTIGFSKFMIEIEGTETRVLDENENILRDDILTLPNPSETILVNFVKKDEGISCRIDLEKPQRLDSEPAFYTGGLFNYPHRDPGDLYKLENLDSSNLYLDYILCGDQTWEPFM